MRSRLFYSEVRMKALYLQQEKSGRLFIDETLHDSCELVDQCEAHT
jgi:hypothetical protein